MRVHCCWSLIPNQAMHGMNIKLMMQKFAAWLVLLIANKEVNFNENCM
jgi:hypothetical protein